jgi:hypothetical protein
LEIALVFKPLVVGESVAVSKSNAVVKLTEALGTVVVFESTAAFRVDLSATSKSGAAVETPDTAELITIDELIFEPTVTVE